MLPKPVNGILKVALVLLGLAVAVALAAAPSNDNFVNARNIASTPYTQNSLDVRSATTESSDPTNADCGDNSALRSVWYKFTAPSTGTMVADTFGSNYDTVLSVWKPGNGGKLAKVLDFVGLHACNDDWLPPPPYTSRVAFPTTAGVVYYFMVSEFSPPPPDQLPETLTFHATFYTAPPNDNFSNATVISGASLPFTGTSNDFAATHESIDLEQSCGESGGPANTIWYRFTPTANTTITVDTFGSDYDTILSAYTGSADPLTEVPGGEGIGCNDDAIGHNPQSQISFAATANTTYSFMVAARTFSSGPSLGNLTLHLYATGNLLIKKNTVAGEGTFTFAVAGPTPSGQTIVTSAGSGSITVSGVSAGAYTVTENTPPAGWTNTSGFTKTVTVPVGGTSPAATFANSATGNLLITKNTNGGDGQFTFSVAGPTPSTQILTTSGGTISRTVSGILAGTYTVTESAPPAGWTNTSGSTQIVTVPLGGTSTAATFTNATTGGLLITKNTTGGDGTFTFSVAGPSPSTKTITTSGGSGAITVPSVAAGTYTVTETTPPAGWTNTSGLTKIVTVPVGASSPAAAFANTAKGSLLITKNTLGGNGTFTFSVAGPTPSTQTIATSGGTGSVTVTGVTAGAYTVTESAPPAGWTNTSGLTQSVTVPINGTSPAATFSNTATGNLLITKSTIGDDDTFTFSVSGPTPSTQTLTTSGGTGSLTVTGVTAGAYTVTENTPPSGWTNTSGLTKTVTVPFNGTSPAAAFANTARGNLLITKTTIGGDLTFTFAVAGPTPSTQTITTSGGSGSAMISGVIGGAYTVTESTPPTGWTNTSGLTQTVTVPVGVTITAAFTNAATGNLLITKNTSGGDGQFTFTVDGPSPSTQIITTSGGAASRTVSGVVAGTYTVTEGTPPTGWTNTSGLTRTVTVPVNGTSAAAGFTNTISGGLLITKNTTGGDGTFTFTVTGPTPSTQTITTSGGAGAITVPGVAAGSYTVTENTPPPPWTNTSGFTKTVTVPESGTSPPAAFTNDAGKKRRGQITSQ